MNNAHGGTIYKIARKFGIEPRDLLDFSANINPLGFSRRVEKVFSDHSTAILNYPDCAAYAFIRELSRYHNLPCENLLAGNGSTEFIFLLPRLLKPGKVLIVVPAFSEYESSVRLANGKVFYFITREGEKFTIVQDTLLKEMQQGYDALYICNPGNPTGVLTPYEVVKQIVRHAQERETQVIVDETFIDFNENHSLKYAVNQFENLYVLRSMTKFYAIPGLRAGYIISCRENIAKLRRMQEPWSMNALAQCAGIESLKDSAYIKRTLQYVSAARQTLASDLQKFSSLKTFESAANYLLLKLRDSARVSVAELYERLLQRKIIIRACHNFQGLDDRYFRIAVKKKSENKRLVAELKNIL